MLCMEAVFQHCYAGVLQPVPSDSGYIWTLLGDGKLTGLPIVSEKAMIALEFLFTPRMSTLVCSGSVFLKMFFMVDWKLLVTKQ